MGVPGATGRWLAGTILTVNGSKGTVAETDRP